MKKGELWPWFYGRGFGSSLCKNWIWESRSREVDCRILSDVYQKKWLLSYSARGGGDKFPSLSFHLPRCFSTFSLSIVFESSRLPNTSEHILRGVIEEVEARNRKVVNPISVLHLYRIQFLVELIYLSVCPFSAYHCFQVKFIVVYG